MDPQNFQRRSYKAYIGNTLSAVKHGGTSVIVLDYFVSSGTGNLQYYEGKMASSGFHQEILEQKVMLYVMKLKHGHHWTFQKDNDSKHTTKYAKALVFGGHKSGNHGHLTRTPQA